MLDNVSAYGCTVCSLIACSVNVCMGYFVWPAFGLSCESLVGILVPTIMLEQNLAGPCINRDEKYSTDKLRPISKSYKWTQHKSSITRRDEHVYI